MSLYDHQSEQTASAIALLPCPTRLENAIGYYDIMKRSLTVGDNHHTAK